MSASGAFYRHYITMSKDRTEQIIQLAREQGMIRPRDLRELNIPTQYLHRLYESGRMQRSGRGIYILTDAEISENYSLAEACKRVPHGVLCLLTALRFHNLGTQSPHQVWIAIHPKDRLPHIDYPPVKIVRFSGEALSLGVEEHQAPEGIVRVYNVPKTVADCFRYRNKIGLEVALEALRECWRERRATMDELWQYAVKVHIISVMKPYLEALI